VEQQLFSVEEAADILGVGSTFIKHLLRDGRLRSTKIVGRRLISRQAIEAFVALVDVVAKPEEVEA
jgi:excisionase family DNA binding protein